MYLNPFFRLSHLFNHISLSLYKFLSPSFLPFFEPYSFFLTQENSPQNHDSSKRGAQPDESLEDTQRHGWVRGGCRVRDSDSLPLRRGGGRIINEVSRDPMYQTDFDTFPGRKYFTCINFEVINVFFRVLYADFDTFWFMEWFMCRMMASIFVNHRSSVSRKRLQCSGSVWMRWLQRLLSLRISLLWFH